MSGYRITKLVCPSCKGSGEFDLTLPGQNPPCMWCKGAKRLPVKDALRYADTTYMIAGGGFIAGDHDYEDMVQMEREAEAIYALAGRKPNWSVRP